MMILSKKKNLRNTLEKVRGKEIHIVTAFASGTEDHIDSLIKNNKKVSMVVGTINSFSSPKFITHCAKKKLKKFDFSVDFRAGESIHWKLYLVSPDTVIIGSANYTRLGLALTRDTCLKIKDGELYDKYLLEYSRLRKQRSVVAARDRRFSELLEIYSNTHREQQRNSGRSSANKSLKAWLMSEENQSIPVFIWSENHTKESREVAKNLLERETGDIGREAIREFFTYEGSPGELPYTEGNVVLTAKNDGKYLVWHTFDVILWDEGMFYIYSLKKPNSIYYKPFRLGRSKNSIAKMIPNWYEEGVSEVDRDEFERLAKIR